MKNQSIVSLCVVGLMMAGCASSENKNTMRGAGIGAAAGGVLGAVVGNQSGNAAGGAAIGALLGGAVGGHMGRRMDQQAKELEKIAETRRTDQGLITKLKSDILFDTGKSVLKPAAKTNLKQMADIMKKYPENVLTINGYTDNTGSNSVNEKLSLARAGAVKSELVSNGIPAGTVNTQGLGPANPVDSNETATGRQKNRRVEVEVTVDETKVPKA